MVPRTRDPPTRRLGVAGRLLRRGTKDPTRLDFGLSPAGRRCGTVAVHPQPQEEP